MGTGNSKSIDNNFFNEDIIVEDCVKIKTENIDIKKKEDIIDVENNSYYNNSFDDYDNKFNNSISDSLDDLDIEGIFASYKIEFGTKSKTRRIIEKFNNQDKD
tara:strand:- start:192 stop:500 length:309 start_codon:yes stop_codon:yes gene_type:complete